MLADLHAHYPMHLIPPEQGTGARLAAWRAERLRALIVDAISRLANYQGPSGEPGVTIELMQRGDVGVVLSVLYSPFDEIDFERGYSAPPEPAYFDRLLDALEVVERDVRSRPDDARIVRSADGAR